ncbi:MAG: chorismate-binding protein [Acutalibacteraceae bacterium]
MYCHSVLKWKIHRNLLMFTMLRAANPSPYLYYFKHKDYQIAGASPEMLVNVTKNCIHKPIIGTIGRSILEEEDKNWNNSFSTTPKSVPNIPCWLIWTQRCWQSFKIRHRGSHRIYAC